MPYYNLELKGLHGGWIAHPNIDMFEYATNFTMKGKYIVKLCGKNKYVGLFTLENLRGGGDVPEMDIMERSMLSKLKLQELSAKRPLHVQRT